MRCEKRAGSGTYVAQQAAKRQTQTQTQRVMSSSSGGRYEWGVVRMGAARNVKAVVTGLVVGEGSFVGQSRKLQGEP